MPPRTTGASTRRERLRRQTIEEIEQSAFTLLDEGGVAAVSLAAVGKAMDMTPPALYRYFGSREALVDALVSTAYADLGAAVASAARDGDRADERVVAIAHEYRRWALGHPRRYMMLFTDRPPGSQDPAEGVTAFNEAMLALLAALTEIAPAGDASTTAGDGAFERWSGRIGGPDSASRAVLQLAVLAWSRIHGLVTLEIAGALGDMGLDVDGLVESEIRTVLLACGP